MCYPKPGPRCSAHAAANLQRVRVAKKLTPFDFDTNDAVAQAVLEYDATPAGMKELQRRIDQQQRSTRKGEKNRELTEYQMRLDLGVAKRKEALAAIKAKDRGDITRDHQDPEVTFPQEFHQLRAEPYVGTDGSGEKPALLKDQPEMVEKMIADSYAWTQKLTADEIEAVSFMTSNGSFVINQTLTNTRDNLHADDNERGKAAIAHLDSALAKSERKTPIKVYRGISREVLEAQGYDGDSDGAAKYVADNFKVGETWSTPVYQSTTLDYQKARGFARSGLTLEILAKHAGPVSNVSAWSYGEAEYLAPRNQPYRVVSIQTFTDTLPRRDGGVYTYERCVVQLQEI